MAIGSVLLTVTEKVSGLGGFVLGKKPEKKPPVWTGEQALVKSPWTTLWFPGA